MICKYILMMVAWMINGEHIRIIKVISLMSFLFKGAIWGLIWFWLVAWGSSKAATLSHAQVITEKDNGRTLILRVADEVVLQLPNPASGGYDQITPIYASGVLKLTYRNNLPPEPSPVPKYGDFGKIVFGFKAINLGKTDLVIRIARKWEVKRQPKEYFRVKIAVRE